MDAQAAEQWLAQALSDATEAAELRLRQSAGGAHAGEMVPWAVAVTKLRDAAEAARIAAAGDRR